jgi:hypothetical protein
VSDKLRSCSYTTGNNMYRITIEFATAAIRRTISSGTAGTDPGRKIKIQDPLCVCPLFLSSIPVGHNFTFFSQG